MSWAGGLFEGEGSVGKRKTRVNKRGGMECQIAVEMYDKDVVEKFYKIIGKGKVYGPYQRKHGITYKWSTSRKNDIIFIHKKLKPYLCSRRLKQFDDALKMLEGVNARL